VQAEAAVYKLIISKMQQIKMHILQKRLLPEIMPLQNTSFSGNSNRLAA